MKTKQGNKGSRTQTIRAPAAQNKSSRQSGRTRQSYRESERVTTISGSVAFNVVDSLPCNPGLAGSFPWLSGHASLYDKYRVKKLIYKYKNLKGTNSDGNVLMSFDYDTLDCAPTTAVEMTQSTLYVDGAPWRLFQLSVKPDGRELFVRTGLVAGADLKSYDMGRLHIATEGCADTSDHGYLEVEYDIELFDKSPLGGNAFNNTRASEFNNASGQDISSTSAVLLCSEVVTNPLSISEASGVYTPPAGAYLVLCEVTGNGNGIIELEMEVDGASLSPAVLSGATSVGATVLALHHVITFDGTQTCRFRMDGSTSCVTTADSGRVVFLAL
jgi:hypothetical protein